MSEAWDTTTLGEVAKWGSGGTPKSGDPRYYAGGTIPWAVIGDVQDAPLRETSTYITQAGAEVVGHLAPEGSVLVTMYGTVGRVALTRRTMATNQAIAWGVPDPQAILPEFLFYVIMSQRAKLESQARGATQRNINRQMLRDLEILLPPLPVQRRVVDLMTHQDNHLANLKAEREALVRLESPLMESIVNGDSVGSDLVALGEVGEFIRGRRFTKSEYVDEGLGCIHYGQLHTTLGRVTKQVSTFLPEGSRARLRLARPGDVVVAATSEDVEGLGRATVWLGDDEVAVHDDCYIFRHPIDPHFASYLFASTWFRNQKGQYADGTKVSRISASDLAAMRVPLPRPESQRVIGEAWAQLGAQIDEMVSEERALKSVRVAVLHRLLSGEALLPESYDALLAEVA